MNRQQRRQAAFKRTQRTQRDRNAVEPSAVLRPILMCRQFGADAVALADVPPMLDFYCDLLTFSSPQNMTDALMESINRMNLQRSEA